MWFRRRPRHTPLLRKPNPLAGRLRAGEGAPPGSLQRAVRHGQPTRPTTAAGGGEGSAASRGQTALCLLYVCNYVCLYVCMAGCCRTRHGQPRRPAVYPRQAARKHQKQSPATRRLDRDRCTNPAAPGETLTTGLQPPQGTVGYHAGPGCEAALGRLRGLYSPAGARNSRAGAGRETVGRRHTRYRVCSSGSHLVHLFARRIGTFSFYFGISQLLSSPFHWV